MKRILLLLILSVCLLPLWPQKTVTPVKPLSARIDALIEHKLPAGSNVAISVYDLTVGKPLYGYQADKLSRPASTMKLLTTITALSRPEADEPFRTEVWYQGTIERDTLQGDMYVIGGYDPEFDEEALDSLVAAVARFPFSVIKGKVYGDVSMKDSLYWGSGWLWDDTPYSFQPYLSPLMLNKGVVKVTATPGERGDSARLECTPASSYYTLTNKTQSRTPSAGRFRVSRDWLVNGNNITVTGNVDARRAGTVNIFSSQDFFMHTFMERLQARGIRCIPAAEAEVSYLFGEFRQDSLSVRMASYETSVQDVVKQIMKESDNLNAEAMLCRLGVHPQRRQPIPIDVQQHLAQRRDNKRQGEHRQDYRVHPHRCRLFAGVRVPPAEQLQQRDERQVEHRHPAQLEKPPPRVIGVSVPRRQQVLKRRQKIRRLGREIHEIQQAHRRHGCHRHRAGASPAAAAGSRPSPRR